MSKRQAVRKFRDFNASIYDILNLDEWNDYTGEGIRISSVEAIRKEDVLPFEMEDLYNEDSEMGSKHGKWTMITAMLTAPGASYVNVGETISMKAVKKLIDNKIDIVYMSVGGVDTDEVREAFDYGKKHGIIFVNSAGNTNEKYGMQGGYGGTHKCIDTAAMGITRRGEVYVTNYSTKSDYIEFASFGNVSLPDLPKDAYFEKTFQGTSFATPMLAGLIARVQEYFVKNLGRKLNQDEMVEFLKINSDRHGFEKREVGYGLFTLPKLKNIDLKMFEEIEEPIIEDKPKEEDKPIIEDKPKEEDDSIMENKPKEKIAFEDLSEDRWSTKYILDVVEKGIMNGYPDKTFKPSHPVTREELATTISKVLDYIDRK